MAPFATSYGGHQFGRWVGQLGDGRTISLGEGVGRNNQRFEIQLKGAGVTPYARQGDGRAVLRSSLREFLCSEAMHHLGVPTTRALALVATGETVVRDRFHDGRPAGEPGAIVCRVAPSFLRFGHFELPAARGQADLLRRLVTFVLSRDFPALDVPPETAVNHLFAEICARTAQLVVHWLRTGFVHGVMNTDNMSILGLTLDYGPYGWMEAFDPAFTPNTTDLPGRRYAFARQGEIARWNLQRLAEALSQISPDPAALAVGLDRYDETYARAFREAFAAKFGFLSWRAADDDLVQSAFDLLHRAEIDMPLFFRRLATMSPLSTACPENMKFFEDAFYRPLCRQHGEAFLAWLTRWWQRVSEEGEPAPERRQRMNAANPCYLLRNHRLQEILQWIEQGDLEKLHALLNLLRQPFVAQPDHPLHALLASRRPDGIGVAETMLSCSS